MPDTSLPCAAWRVFLGDQDLTPKMAPRLKSLTLTEKRAGEADELAIELHNTDGKLVMPPPKAVLTVSLGWERGANVPVGLVGKGTFKIDERSMSGPPDLITLRGKSADLTTGFRVRKDRVFIGLTVGAIVSEIAADNGYTPHIDPDLSGQVIPVLGNGAMSDAALLKALGHQFDAVATVKAGKLIFARIGKATTATGKALPAITIDRREAADFSFTAPERDQHDGVEARWHDKGSASQHTVTVGHAGDGHPQRLRRIYASQEAAQQAADAANRRMERKGAKLDLTLSYGRPDWSPGCAVTVTGYPDPIDAIGWQIAEITHTMDGQGGLTSRLALDTGAKSG